MKYFINKNKSLFIIESVAKKLRRHTQKLGMTENGGILLGKLKTDFSKYVITDITTPSREDEQGENIFIRNKEQAQIEINSKWQKSNGVINYLGEWHTHPVVNPAPSEIDKILLDDCIKNNIMEYKELFMIIIGAKGRFYVGYQNESMEEMCQLKEI